jgi:hypothetical protein
LLAARFSSRERRVEKPRIHVLGFLFFWVEGENWSDEVADFDD